MAQMRRTKAIIILGVASALALSPAFARRQESTKGQTVEIREYKGEKLDSIETFEENSIKGPQHVEIGAYRHPLR